MTIYPVSAGDIVTLDDSDYRYGQGTLRLRVTGIIRVVPFADGDHLYVRGLELLPSGAVRSEREAYLRLAALLKMRSRA